MKLKKLLGISLVCFCFLNIISCSDDNDDDNNVYLKTEDLYQTVWRGTLENYYNDKSSPYNIGLEFTTKAEGSCSYRSIESTGYGETHFTYEIEEKIIYIDAGDLITGYWTVTKHNKNNLTMQRNLSSADGKSVATITLSRVN